MPVFLFHILMQSVMEGGRVDTVEQFLESALLWRNVVDRIFRRFVQSRSDYSDGEETKEEQSEDVVLDFWHLFGLLVGLRRHR